MTDQMTSYIPCPPPELAIIIPTYQEAETVLEVARRITFALDRISWEIIFVDDDSPDGTSERIRNLARRDSRIRLIQRLGRRGLASACIEGMLATSAPFLAVMDADLQHDESLLPQMLQMLKDEQLDIVIGSRYIGGGIIDNWSDQRRLMSRVATRIGQVLLHARLYDPMSGFFVVRAAIVHACAQSLSGVGFKILLDLFASASRQLKFREIPYIFHPRQAGTSKLEPAVLWEYLLMLLHKIIGSWVPIRFIAFSLVGVFGVCVHFITLWSILQIAGPSAFFEGQTSATLIAMTSNFFLNNFLTYRDLRLQGRQLWWGWLSFVVACGIGAFANIGIANALFQGGHSGWIGSALVGILVGAVWNYAVTAIYTWQRR